MNLRDLTMKSYLVTGGAGFIGSNFVKYILSKNDDIGRVVVLDALTYAGNLLTIKKELDDPRVTFIKGNIADASVVNDIFHRFDPDFVVNFAAESHVDRSITNPRLFLETNVLGTQTLLDCARRSWALPDGGYKPGKRYLQISTDEVYGSLSKDFDSSRPLSLREELSGVVKGRGNIKCYGDGFFVETTPLSPRSPYSASKASADMITLAYHDTYGLPVNITRCSNNYGPYHFPEKLIPLVIKNILDNKTIPVYGEGVNVRDWLYVGDHAKAIDMVLRNGRVGEIYNIGGFNEERNIDLVKTIIDTVALLVKENPVYLDLFVDSSRPIDYSMITFVADRPGHDMRYAIDPTKIATELGWYPETPLNLGLAHTVKWYLDNSEWVESVTSGDYQRYYDEMYTNR